MAALDFPSSPTNGQTYTANGATWTYNSATTSWLSSSSSSLSTTLSVPSGGTGLTSLTLNYIPFGNGTSAFGSSSDFTWDDAAKKHRINGQLALNGATSIPAQFYFGGTAPSGTDVYSIYTDQTISAVTTGSASAVTSNLSTAAAAFTLPSLNHFVATKGTFGAGSTVTTQRGFYAHNSLTGATNNYGFFSDIAAGTNCWNFYSSGTAYNFFQGAVGTGTGPLAYTQLRIGSTGPSSSNLTYSVYADQTAPATTTSEFASFYSVPNTAASAFTLGTLFHYIALQGTIGAGSAITNQFGFYVGNNLTGATNNYGFYSNIPSGTNRWNIYANGTAANYFGGDVGIGATSNTTGCLLDVRGVQCIDVNNNQLLLHSGASSHPTVIHRNDTANYYILLSAAGTSASGTWNTLRPLTIALTTGLLTSQNGQAFTGGLSTDNLKITALTGLVKANGASNATVATAGTDYMVPSTNSTISAGVGFAVTSTNQGTPTGGNTLPLSPLTGNYQYLTNNAAFTIQAPSVDGALDVLVTNGASAGAITMSGFTAPTGGGGDTYATTNALKFLLMVRRINGTSTYAWKALQ